MQSVHAQSQSEKTFQWLNIASIFGTIILLILLPIIGLMSGFRVILYVASIIFGFLNIGFYLAPENYRLLILKKRYLYVYIPALVIVGICVFDIIEIIISLAILEVATIFFIVICGVQAFTFAVLVAKLAQNSQGLLK